MSSSKMIKHVEILLTSVRARGDGIETER